MNRYIMNPTEVFAMQWKGDNQKKIKLFAGDNARFENYGEIEDHLLLKTINGVLKVHKGWYIVKNGLDQYYPWDEESFNNNFVKAE